MLSKLNLITIIGILLIVGNVNAQKNYVEARIISTSKDTIAGYIDYQNWRINPRSISFKNNMAESTPTVYAPGDIHSFMVENDFYLSSNVDKEVSLTNTSDLTDNSEPIIKKDLVFLRSLIQGEKRLYYLRDGGKDHFYINDGNEVKLLIY